MFLVEFEDRKIFSNKFDQIHNRKCMRANYNNLSRPHFKCGLVREVFLKNGLKFGLVNYSLPKFKVGEIRNLTQLSYQNRGFSSETTTCDPSSKFASLAAALFFVVEAMISLPSLHQDSSSAVTSGKWNVGGLPQCTSWSRCFLENRTKNITKNQIGM